MDSATMQQYPTPRIRSSCRCGWSLLCSVLLLGTVRFGDSFTVVRHGHTGSGVTSLSSKRPPNNNHHNNHRVSSSLRVAPLDHAVASPVLADYAPAATSLFNNMKLPAAVVTAGMISLGFATSFPELPDDTPTRRYSARVRRRCDTLRRVHIVTALVSVTSELIVVMWAAVEVNQLTERVYRPAGSVWDLIDRDCDLAWSAVNSHFVLGIVGFVTMLALRAYVMLLAAEASAALTAAASTGTAAALCLMISVVNRGVEAGGGEGVGYGRTILDLIGHYAALLLDAATDAESPGALQSAAILLEAVSLLCIAQVTISGQDRRADDDDLRLAATTTFDVDASDDVDEPLNGDAPAPPPPTKERKKNADTSVNVL